jgi:hypothetical protein
LDITKVLEILNKHIIKLEEDISLKDWEIRGLKEKLSNVEKYIERMEVENGKV